MITMENNTFSGKRVKNESNNGSVQQNLLNKLHHVLETYANVHRGSGFNSTVTTALYEKARESVIRYLGVEKSKFTVIFCSPWRAKKIAAMLNPESYIRLKDSEFGLSLGVNVMILNRKTLPKNIPFAAGGGTTRLYSTQWVIQAGAPERFEAGTPAILNCIAFALVLNLSKTPAYEELRNYQPEKLSVKDILYNDELEGLSGLELLQRLASLQIGHQKTVPTLQGEKPFVNFDNSASTPTFTPIWDTFAKTLFQPRTVQNEVIGEVRKISAEVLGVPQNDYEIIFTSNTTESINFVAECIAGEKEPDIEPVVLITNLEHSSNDLPWRQIPGWQVNRLPVNKLGFWDFAVLEKVLNEYNKQNIYGQQRIKIVAVSGASNVLGSCNDLTKTAEIVHRYGAKLLVDGAQLVAHRKVNIAESEIDFFALSAHKIYAPMGSGLLISRKGLLHSDIQTVEKINSSGEQNPAGIAALGKALYLLSKIGFDVIQNHELELTRKTLAGFRMMKEIKVFGLTDPDSPLLTSKTGVIGFDIKNMPAGKVAKQLALYSGIGTRYGCHCAHVLIKYLLDFTPFLEQFQRLIVLLVPPLKLQGFTRVSFGIQNRVAEVDLLLETLEKIASKKLPENVSKTEKETSALIKSEISRIIKMVYES
jgi:selenocysteine lyase/cysteine desulfurase